MTEPYEEMSVGILTINGFDVVNSFPDEEREMVRNITSEQLNAIAPLAWEKIKESLGDSFWEIFSDSIREATMEVLDLDFDDDYKLVKE